MADLIFVGQFVANKAGKTGLTVTVDVDRYTISDGTRSSLVTAGSATEGRRGLYHYRLASADLSLYQYVATFITTDATVDQQEVAAIGLVVPDALVSSRSTLGGTAQTGDAYAVVTNATYGLDKLARTGADSDTLKTLSDQIDGVSAGTIAAAVWAVASGSGTEDTYGNILDDLTEESGGTYRFTTAALAQAPGGGGTLYSYSSTVDDGSNPLDGVFIQCSTNASFTNIIGTTYSNASGAYTVRSDTAGTHYLRFQLAGWNFSDETVTLA